MISNLFNKNIIGVLTFFLISPGSRYNRKEIKEKTGMNNIPLDNTLKKLLSLKILREKNRLFGLDIESEEIKKVIEYIKEEYKRFNLPYKIFNIIIEISNRLSEIKQIEELYLFGSYAKLIYHEKSDIDLAVIFHNKIKNRGKLEKKIERTIEKIGKKNKKKIEVHFFLEKDMKERDPLIKDILRNGKKLL